MMTKYKILQCENTVFYRCGLPNGCAADKTEANSMSSSCVHADSLRSIDVSICVIAEQNSSEFILLLSPL